MSEVEDDDRSNDEEREEVVASIEERKTVDFAGNSTLDVSSEVTCLSFNPCEDVLVAGGSSGRLYSFRYEDDIVTDNTEKKIFKNDVHEIDHFSSGDKFCLVGDESKLRIIDSQTLSACFKLDEIGQGATCLRCIGDKMVVVGDHGGDISLLDIRNKKTSCLIKSEEEEDFVACILWKKETNHLFFASGNGLISKCDLRNSKKRIDSEPNNSDVTSAAFIRDESFLACCCLGGEIAIYETKNLNRCGTYKPCGKKSGHCVVPVSENVVVVGWEDGNLRAHHLFPNLEVGTIGEHSTPAKSLDVSCQGELLASSATDCSIKLWHTKFLEDVNVETKNPNKKSVQLGSSQYESRGSFFDGL